MEQPNDPPAGAPPTDAAVHGGSFFGIPYGWPLGLAIVGLILFMWMARHPVRQVLWQVFFITGRVFGRWGLWLGEHGRNARIMTSEKIASHRADELQEKLVVLEDRLGRRAEKLPKETGPIIARLDTSTHELATAAHSLADINLEDAAERAFRAALPSMESGRGLNKLEKNIAQNTARAMNERLMPVRPALTALKTEGPRIRDLSEKLNKTCGEFNQGVDQVNKAFSEFEMIMHSEDRIKIASRASIVIPWLIALLITGIALSGVFLNFFLIERPMSEIVGEGSKIGGVGLPAFAALIVIFLEFVAGVVLMDALGFTKLIPAFNSMSDGGRRILLIGALIFLIAFSFLEAFLAIVREQIIEQNAEVSRIAVASMGQNGLDAAAQNALQSSVKPAVVLGLQLPTLAQIILAVVIPWLLATAALPLETIVRNSVFMISIASSYAMMTLAFICKTISVLLKNAGLFILSVYDLVIFFPLWIEKRAKGQGGGGSRRRKEKGEASDDDDLMALDEPANQKPNQPPRRERDKRERELQRA
ncbi:MAG TPA: hypothetical protein VG942_10420 [Hyphomonadaceae bacterium]|nr:hypothetical protein [Hyphomonadaceae bacterium]